MTDRAFVSTSILRQRSRFTVCHCFSGRTGGAATMSEPAAVGLGVGMSATVEGLDRLLALADELGTLFKMAEPSENLIHLYHAHFLCRCLLGADRHVDDLVGELDRIAPTFFAHCAKARCSGDLEMLRKVITDDLLHHVRVRLVLLQRWKGEEAKRLAS